MNHIFYFFGKSCSGKDTIIQKIFEDKEFVNKYNLHRLVYSTTRPMREGEEDGITYHYTTNEYYDTLDKNSLIDSRSYLTEFGLWRYFVDRKSIVNGNNYIAVGTIDTIPQLKSLRGFEIHVIYIDIDAITALRRYSLREHNDAMYKEIVRRVLSDYDDFSFFDDKVKPYKDAGIIQTVDTILNSFYNDLNTCVETTKYIIANRFN